MSSGGRKHVFVYSVQHTGTWFLIRLLRSAYPKHRSQQCGDQWFRRHTARDINTDNLYLADKPINKNFLIKYGERLISEEQLKNVELLIAHGHHNRPNGGMLRALTNHKPEIPICIPMRDPLLSVNSKLWREYGSWNEILNWEDKEDRIARIEQFSNNIVDLLTIPKENVFLFPIDFSYDEEQKLLIGKNLCKFCDVPFNKGVQEYLLNWLPQNETSSRPGVDKEFSIIRKAYSSGDIKQLNKYLDIEINYLRSRKDLIDKLKTAGYNDLAWW